MTGLREIGGDKIIADRVAAGRPVLGVCVGMQILFARGVEFGVETHGLRAVARRRRPAGRSGDPAHGLERRRRARAGSALFKGLDADHPVLLRALLRRAAVGGRLRTRC